MTGTTTGRTRPASPPSLGIVPRALRLWGRFAPPLLLIALTGVLLRSLLLDGAVTIGFINHLAGLVTLTLVVLVKLLVVIALFHAVKPGLPALNAALDTGRPDTEIVGNIRRTAGVVTIALVPFFVYYAAWGFLGDTIREYSRIALARAAFGQSGFLLDVIDGWWLVFAVVLSWAIRRGAKAIKEKKPHPVWDVIIVVCEANWAFIGLFVFSRWNEQAIATVAGEQIAALGQAAGAMLSVSAAHAAALVPADRVSPGLWEQVQGVFFYALLPVVWLTIATLVYGYDVHSPGDAGSVSGSLRVDRLLERYKTLPKFIRDFIAHFTGGYLKRYRAVSNSVRLTLRSGLLLILVLIVSYRLIDWLSAWAWLGMTRLVGPDDLTAWQFFSSVISVFLGSPSDPGDGAIPETLKICLLAATLERAFVLHRRMQKA